MRSLLFFTSLSISLNFHALASSNMPSTFADTGIPNSHLVSTNTIRGMAPKNVSDLQRLLGIGVKKFLIFKIDTNGDVAKEKSNLRALGVASKDILHLEFPWEKITDYGPVCEMTVEALNMLLDADNDNEKTYFHCTMGEDRTGYLAGLYRIYGGSGQTRIEVFENEMCDRGYEAGNPEKIYSVVKRVRENLTPAFMAMADLIEGHPSVRLTKAMCRGLVIPRVDFKQYGCKKSKLL